MEKVLLKFCKEMLGLPPNASTIAVYGETGAFPQWLRSYYRAIRYFVKAHTSAPPLALTVLKSLPNRKRIKTIILYLKSLHTPNMSMQVK